MHRRAADATSFSSGRSARHAWFLTGVSVAAMLTASPDASARPLGGSPLSISPSQAAVDASQADAAAAAQAGKQAQSALSRAASAIQALQAMQAAARNAAATSPQAAPSGVTDGLQAGGLDRATGAGATWIGANLPTQTLQGGRSQVGIAQTQKNAVLTWRTFNISGQTDLSFDQQGNRDWVALNRVIDPNLAPSRILGAIKSDGTVLVINPNGIIFGAGGQINVGSLIASTLDVGPSAIYTTVSGAQKAIPTDLAWRNQNFLQNGLLGYDASTGPNNNNGDLSTFAQFSAFSVPRTGPGNNPTTVVPTTGTISVAQGASIVAADGGRVLLTAPHVANAGRISAPAGQIILAATDSALLLTPSTGATGDAAPLYGAQPDTNVRGLAPFVQGGSNASGYFVWNQAGGLIDADRGNITLVSPNRNTYFTVGGASYNDGVLSTTTSVSRNGSITIDGSDVRLGVGALLAILPDGGGETIPQDPTSLSAYKPSAIRIGENANTIEMQSGAFLFAPGANAQFGASVLRGSSSVPLNQSILIDADAEINVAGLTDVQAPIRQVQIVIDPAKKNELRDSPLYRDGFLNGAAIYLDPRRSGVRADGVAWIGSPLIDATAYYQLVGLSADRLMTRAGNVAFGPAANAAAGALQVFNTPNVYLRAGSLINTSGGWTRFQAGAIRTTKLIDQFGRIVDIGDADPNAVYVGIAGGFTRHHAHWGLTETWTDPLRMNSQYVPAYTEGRDAGALTATAATLVLDATLSAQVYAGDRQLADSKAGAGTSSVTGDLRAVQSSSGQLPAGGALIVNGVSDAMIAHSAPVAPDSAYDGWTRGAIAADTGKYIAPTPATGPVMPASRSNILFLTDGLLSNSGLSQVSLSTLGKITVDSSAGVTLNPGGVFGLTAGRSIAINGDVSAPSGRISLETAYILGSGSLVGPNVGKIAALGDFDIAVAGDLSVAGQWVNEYTAPLNYIQNRAWSNGGAISIKAAANILQKLDNRGNAFAVTNLPVDTSTYSVIDIAKVRDISGSILVGAGSTLNLSGGGRVDRKRNVDLSAKGGSLSLSMNVGYYQTDPDNHFPGFQVDATIGPNQFEGTSINPDRVNAHLVLDPAAIKAHGLGGGGDFTLVTPEFALGTQPASVGAALPLDFFSTAGFAKYNITSTKTELTPNTFNNGIVGNNALLAVQTITIGAGQTLALQQSVLPNLFSADLQQSLLALDSGGDINTLLTASAPADAWNQRAVSLVLGGALELRVAQGGSVTGAAGSSLMVGALLNEGSIRIAGGSITQQMVLPRIYAAAATSAASGPFGVHALSDIFTIRADGEIYLDDASRLSGITNITLAANRAIYKAGVLDQGQGVVLAAGSVTDLSGAVILNPLAADRSGRSIAAGVVVGGGTLATMPTIATDTTSITSPIRVGGALIARPGAVLDLSGAAGAFDVPASRSGLRPAGYVSTPVWSDAGALSAGAGATLTGATIHAQGGSADAQGGALQFLNPIFTQHDPAAPTANVISADMLAQAGFDTFVAMGDITSQGDARVGLDRAFFLLPKPFSGLDSLKAATFTSVISTGGALAIEAPYIALQNQVDQAALVTTGTAAGGSVTFRAGQIDITGTVLFDKSVANATFNASGDIRLTGVAPWKVTYSGVTASTPSLRGMIAANGDLTMIAGQIYPTTGSSFAITSAAANGAITIGRSSAATPATPYSAGGNLLIQAANIIQGGVIRAPFGTLTLGSNAASTAKTTDFTTTYAPATKSVVLANGSITGVSANGLSIPYGATTDTVEWYFAPTSNNALTAPPAKALSLNGGIITLAAGAAIDLSGGGDVYAYEFVAGTGGSHDVLSQFNSDQYSGNKINGVGYQYPDGRQVYAIAPGLSNAPVAAYDPIYSANYPSLTAASEVGKRVYLSGGNGVAAGWYTLLPAQYAMLPGGMRVVEQTGANYVTPGLSVAQADGSLLTSGYYGDALSGASQSQLRLFSVQSQDVIRSYSKIVLTSGNNFAITKATGNGAVVPRTGLDAGRLVLNPVTALSIEASVMAAAAPGGRGAQVDISGSNIDIVSTLAAAPNDGAIHLTAAGLNRLNAESLLIGGVRTDNADGATSLALTARSILVANDAANPLVGPEILLAVDDGSSGSIASSLTLNDGATIIATGALSDQRAGAYVIDGQIITNITLDFFGNKQTNYLSPSQIAIGAFLRVANGPQRVVQRLRTPVSATNPGSPAGLAANLNVGNVTLQGNAIGLDTSHNAAIASGAQLRGQDIAFGAGALAFTSGNVAAGALAITPQLLAVLSQGSSLTLRSQGSIGFDDGSYSFGAMTFDAATLESRQGGSVTINGTRLQLTNSGTAGAPVTGGGALSIAATEIWIGSGTLATANFASVSLAAANGMFSTAGNGVIDVGSANLALVTPYIGDRAVAGTGSKSATTVTLRTTGAVNVSNAGTTAIDVANLPGIPGSSLTIAGNSVSIAGTRLRATAGSLTVNAGGNLVLSNGAVLEAPGYSKTFGDAADPQTVSAPGGALSLVALGSGGIALGDALLSVGGGAGNGGNLKLTTPNGAVDWGTAVLNGKGGAGAKGGSFALDSNGSIDLVAMNDRVVANGFTAGFDVRTRSGDIVLAAGQVLKSGAVKLTADGGFVTIGGTIDTSGVNGGDIELYGVNGVTLQGAARLDAHASGYAADDTRQAKAGNITLGADFLTGRGVIQADGSVKGTTADSGSIAINAGAAIDASASRPGDRLVRVMRNGAVNYQYVQGDQGGIVSFRAPVVTDGNGDKTVNVSVASAGSIKGARAIDLEGFKRWDLATVAASGLYSGVTRDATTNTITLDVTADLDTANPNGATTSVGKLNFLGDNGAGTVVEFVQGFDVSAAHGNLGGLDAQANFNARPGVELRHDGNITLASNWNLGAGAVNVTAAQAAGAMATDSFSGQDYVVVGREADLLANYTTMTYRVGGRATGAAPLVSLRASGDLHLQGSLTDGFFQFRDQYDATYQSYLYAKRSSDTTLLLGAWQGANGSSYVSWQTYLDNPATNFDPNGYFGGSNLIFDTQYWGGQSIDQLTPNPASGGPLPRPTIPFSAVGNSPAAQGTGAGGVGDPLASAVVMPLLPNGQIVASSDYRLTAGAALSSVDPLRIAAASAGNLLVDGPKPQTMYISPAMIGAPGGLLVGADDIPDGTGVLGPLFRAGQPGFDAYLQNLIPGLSGDAAITLQYASDVPPNLATFINQTLAADPNAHVVNWTDPNYYNHQVTISVSLFSQFLQQYPGGFGGAQKVAIPLLPQTVVRTGAGSIRMAAAGNVDLTGGSAIQYIKSDGSADTTPDISKGQLGGAAVYTAGHPVASISEVLPDPATGAAVQITALASTTSIFSAPPVFTYGVTGDGGRRDIASVVIADTMQLVGGGDIGVTAQGDVLGRRDLSFGVLANNRNASWPLSPWIGKVTFLNGSLPALAYDQPWRIGSVTQDATMASINPQLFRAGIGALGGGNIRIDAGGKASDILAVADTSLVTGVATMNGSATKVLLTLGGGNVAIRAGSDILGARIDAPSGEARLSAGGSIGDLPVMTGFNSIAYQDPANKWHYADVPIVLNSETQFRIDDATVDLAAGGRISIMGIGQLDGFYSDRSALNMVANSAITVSNSGMVAPALSGIRLGAYAIYPGTLTLASLLGDVNLRTLASPVGYLGAAANSPPEYNIGAPNAILMAPSPVGQLGILAGGNIGPTQIAMLDSDPYYLPGLFTLGGNVLFDKSFTVLPANAYYQFDFPRVIASMSEAQLERLHNAATTHAGDEKPVHIYAGGDIGTAVKGVTLSTPKQARIEAGRDIVNMVFFGQNLSPTDVTRIVAGRDLIATTTLVASQNLSLQPNGDISGPAVPAKPVVQGNTFILGGPGDLMVEAGRNMGPFLNSAEIKDWNFSGTGDGNYLPRASGSTLRFGEGIVTVGNDWNPYLPAAGANITVQFGTARGADYDALRDAYVAPGAAANELGDYGAKLVDWMRKHAADILKAEFGAGDITEQQAYQAFLTLSPLRQRLFLINEVYFDELRAPSIKDGPSYLKYSRGYAAVNTLFPASLGYTTNGLQGGANDGAIVHAGDLDLRLAAIETVNGGNINILGPGGRVLAGSVVSTAQQAARRNYAGYALQTPQGGMVSPIAAIPPGYEGVLTQRGGSINTFTDGDFLLNQSRLFTVKGGDITMWSSNADLNAGQGAKTTPNFPPVEVRIGENMFAAVDQAGATSGAGIAALPPDPGADAPNVYLLAPRGAVDAGDAGVRAAGNLFVAALRVVNADNFKVGGATTGIATVQAPNIGGLIEASTANATTQQAAAPAQNGGSDRPSVIIVEVLGYGGGSGETPNDGDADRRRNRPDQQTYDPSSPYQVLGVGEMTDEQVAGLAAERRASVGSQ